MQWHITAGNLIICFLMIQSFIFGGILCFKSARNPANRFLGIGVLILATYLLWVLKDDFGFNDYIHEMQFLPMLLHWGVGPSIYLYIVSSIGKKMRTRKILWHYAPMGIEFLLFNFTTLLFYLNNQTTVNFTLLEKVFFFNWLGTEHLIGLSMLLIYLILSFRALQAYLNQSAFRNIKVLLIGFIILWIIWMPYTIYDTIYFRFNFPPSKFYGFYLLFAVLTYCLGFIGFRIKDQIIAKSFTLGKDLSPLELANLEQESVRLKNLMHKEQLYLDPELNLQKVADKMNLHPNTVSAVVNQGVEKSFRDFVNEFRVEAVKAKLNNPAFEQYTLLGIAYECGFNSKASFNRIFKKHTGVSPMEFKEQEMGVLNEPQNSF